MLIMIMGITSTSFAMTHYEKSDFVTGIVTASALNVRSGPGTNYKSVGLVYKNEYVLEDAVNAWMNSQGHKENILNGEYNLTGIGVVKSNTYGYVMFQMFVGK